MKLTRDRLKQIIKEELEEMMVSEAVPSQQEMAELERQLATFKKYSNIPAYAKRAKEVEAQIQKLKGLSGGNTTTATPAQKPTSANPPTVQLKPGDQVKFKDPDNLSGQILGKILTNKQGLDFLNDASARNTSDFRRYGSDGTKKLNDPSGEYFFINPLRSIRQNGLGQPNRSFYVIEKSLLTKS